MKRPNYSLTNQVRLLRSGEAFFHALEHWIDSARQEIHFQTYIFNPDTTGQRIAAALRRAAGRGVKVYLMLDAYGSAAFSGTTEKSLTAAGVNIQRYGRIFNHGKFHIGRRLHRKIVVVDGNLAIVGGINISDQYHGTIAHPPWLDYAVMVAGTAARRLRLICRKRWLNIRFNRIRPHLRKPELPMEDLSGHSTAVRVVRNDFIRNKNEIAIGYRQAIRQAKSSITLVGGYFLPGGRVRRLLRLAVKRGVRIRLILASHSDVMLSVYARQYLYAWLLRHQIEIYEYLPANVHGKVMVCDGSWLTIGSYDLNNLSTYSNIELNLEIRDTGFAGEVTTELEEVISRHCSKVEGADLKRRNSLGYRLLCWLSYRTTKTLFGLSRLLARSGGKL